MKHLCFDYTLFSAAGFNVLYIPVWLLFLHSLSFIELANANQLCVFIHLLPTDKMSVRQEGNVCEAGGSLESGLCPLSTHCMQPVIFPAVHSYIYNKWIRKEKLILFWKNWKIEKMEFFSKFSENWKKEKGFVINTVELKKSPSYSYLHTAKFTE